MCDTCVFMHYGIDSWIPDSCCNNGSICHSVYFSFTQNLPRPDVANVTAKNDAIVFIVAPLCECTSQCVKKYVV